MRSVRRRPVASLQIKDVTRTTTTSAGPAGFRLGFSRCCVIDQFQPVEVIGIWQEDGLLTGRWHGGMGSGIFGGGTRHPGRFVPPKTTVPFLGGGSRRLRNGQRTDGNGGTRPARPPCVAATLNFWRQCGQAKRIGIERSGTTRAFPLRSRVLRAARKPSTTSSINTSITRIIVAPTATHRHGPASRPRRPGACQGRRAQNHRQRNRPESVAQKRA